MASVISNPLEAIAYRTGLQTFDAGSIGTPSSGYYSFGSSRNFSDFIVRLKKVSLNYSQTITEKTYVLNAPGDPDYDPDNPSSYLRYDSISDIDFTYNFVVTDSNYFADISAGTIITPAPFRQRDVGGEGGGSTFLDVWEYNKYNDTQLEAGVTGGSWTANELDSSGSTVSTASGDVIPKVTGSFMPTIKQANSTSWFLRAGDPPVDEFTLGLSAFLGGSSVPSYAAEIFDLENGRESSFESSARSSMPSISGASRNDLFVGVLDGDFPDDEDFPSVEDDDEGNPIPGPPKFRFTQNTSITMTIDLY